MQIGFTVNPRTFALYYICISFDICDIVTPPVIAGSTFADTIVKKLGFDMTYFLFTNPLIRHCPWAVPHSFFVRFLQVELVCVSDLPWV